MRQLFGKKFWFGIFLLLTSCGYRAVLSERKHFVYSAGLIERVTIFLPLSGSMNKAGLAIQRGILAAHYSSKQKLSINFVDENSESLEVLYKKAVDNGSQLIIGPLAKEKLETLLHFEKLPVPIISLNSAEDYAHNYRANLYQFGLSPQDEIIQVAQYLKKMQLKKVGIIVFNESWGKRVATAFQREYTNRYDGQIDLITLDRQNNFSVQICNFLASETKELCNVKERIKKRGTEEEYLMRRQDLDSIFVIANSEQASQVVPLLKFYYAENLPIFTMSTAYNNPKKQLLSDLDDVYLCDIPWNLHFSLLPENSREAYRQLVQIWGKSYSDQNRLYALGVDVYTLIGEFRKFLQGEIFSGATGKLRLDKFNHFSRELTWVQIKKRQLILQ